MKQLETALEALNVEINRYAISNTDDKTDIVVVGGIEVVHRYSVKDFKEVNGSYDKIDIHGSGNEKVLLPFMYTDIGFDTKHIESLIKMRDLKTLSKEQASKYEVVSKDRLLNKLVYIHESNPSTNSIALAEQFQIRHDNVIQQIFKLAEQNPSILMGIKYGVYEVPNIDQSPENQSPECSGDSNLGVSTFRTFLHISEDVYYRFINAMGKPKSKPMVAYRDIKRQEYFKGFQVLRERVLLNGVKEKELNDILKIRTDYTKELISTIKDYVTHYNNNSGSAKQLDFNSVSRLLFNIVNDKAGIDAKDYDHKRLDRDKKDNTLQESLKHLEIALETSLRAGKVYNSNLKDVLHIAFKMDVESIKEHLSNKGVSELITILL